MFNSHKKYAVALLLAVTTANAHALTLNEAMEKAYSHYPDFKLGQQRFLQEIEAMPQAVSAFMPRVSATIDTQRSRNQQSNWPTNGSGTTSSSDDPLYQNSRTITVAQPIFNGGASMAGLSAAQASFKASRARYFSSEQEAFLTVVNAYVEYVSATEKYTISENTLQANLTRLNAVTEQLNLGMATNTELALSQAQVANSESNKLQAQAALRIAKENFVRVIGTEPTDTNIPDIPPLPPTLEELTSKAMVLSPEVEAAKYSNKQANYAAKAAKGALLPSVSLKGSISRGESSGSRSSLFPTPPENTKTKSTVAGGTISMTVPILADGGAEYSRVRSANKQARSAVYALDRTMAIVKVNAIGAWEQYQAAKQTVDSTAKAVAAESLALEGIQQEASLGTKNTLDILNEEDKVYTAKIRHIDAKKDMVISAYRMRAVLGQMTARAMSIKGSVFDPETEFKKLKMQIIGF